LGKVEEDLLAIFEAVGGRLRARFMIELRAGPLRPSKLSQKLEAPISNLYRIFNELKEAKLVESYEHEGMVYWKLTDLGERWLDANIGALSQKALLKGHEQETLSVRRRHYISATISLAILLLAVIRGLMLSQPTYIAGGLILSLLIFVILEKVK